MEIRCFRGKIMGMEWSTRVKRAGKKARKPTNYSRSVALRKYITTKLRSAKVCKREVICLLRI